MYEMGRGVAKSDAEAVSWYARLPGRALRKPKRH